MDGLKDRDPLYKRFWESLNKEVKQKWKGRKSVLAAEAGIKPPSLTAILKGDTKARYETRKALSDACGVDYTRGFVGVDFVADFTVTTPPPHNSITQVAGRAKRHKAEPNLSIEKVSQKEGRIKKDEAQDSENIQQKGDEEMKEIASRILDMQERYETKIAKLEAKIEDLEKQMLVQNRSLQEQPAQSPVQKGAANDQ